MSIEHIWNGSVLTIISDSGASSVDLQGPKGDTGPRGPQGPAGVIANPDGVLVESTEHPGCYYRIVNGSIEWSNPPMLLDVEYRTTKRYLGKPVYVKIVRTELYENSEARVLISNEAKELADMTISCYKDNGVDTIYKLPHINFDEVNVSLEDDYLVLYFNGYFNDSGYYCYATVEYTKEQ